MPPTAATKLLGSRNNYVVTLGMISSHMLILFERMKSFDDCVLKVEGKYSPEIW